MATQSRKPNTPAGITPRWSARRNAWTYLVRYRAPDGRSRGQTFDSLDDARTFLATNGADRARGDWRDPQKARVTFDAYADRYARSLGGRKASTKARYCSALDVWVRPEFDERPIGTITKADVVEFLAGMADAGAGHGTRANARKVLSGVLALAVADDAVRANVAAGVTIGKHEADEAVFLTAADVERLADEVEKGTPTAAGARGGNRFGGRADLALAIRVAAYTGLRAGELWALRTANVDTMRGTIDVVEAVPTSSGLDLEPGSTKTYERRTVRLPRHLVDPLAAHIAGLDGDLVFPALRGGYTAHGNFYRRHYLPACKRAGLPARTNFHSLRHTCAAFLADAGLGEVDVMAQLGHSRPVPTYRHLFRNEHGDRIAAALDRTYERLEASGTDGATVLDLDSRRAR